MLYATWDINSFVSVRQVLKLVVKKSCLYKLLHNILFSVAQYLLHRSLYFWMRSATLKLSYDFMHFKIFDFNALSTVKTSFFVFYFHLLCTFTWILRRLYFCLAERSFGMKFVKKVTLKVKSSFIYIWKEIIDIIHLPTSPFHTFPKHLYLNQQKVVLLGLKKFKNILFIHLLIILITYFARLGAPTIKLTFERTNSSK